MCGDIVLELLAGIADEEFNGAVAGSFIAAYAFGLGDDFVGD